MQGKLFDRDDRFNLPQYFQPLFGTQNDLSFINSYNNSISNHENFSFHEVPGIRLFRIYNEQETKIVKDYQKPEKPYTTIDLISFLRHLLQLTDKLPILEKIPPKIKTLRDFFEVYLVRRGDPLTYAKRKFYSDSFFNNYSAEQAINNFNK